MKKKFINKRKKNFFYFNLNYYLFFFVIFFLFIYLVFNYQKIFDISYQLIQKYSDKYNYNVKHIEIINYQNLTKYEIVKYFEEYKDKSIFLVPLNQKIKEINQNKWVKNVKIRSDYKNTLKIFLEEEIPIGIYVVNNQYILFSQDLVILDIVNNISKYSKLIKFYGENAIENSKKLVLLFDNEIKNSIDSAIYINNRRWNIKLNNAILLKLPERNIKEAILNYKKIYNNLSNKELNDIESIDLRLKNQATIKYKN